MRSDFYLNSEKRGPTDDTCRRWKATVHVVVQNESNFLIRVINIYIYISIYIYIYI